MHRKGNYGVDSPGIVVALLALGFGLLLLGNVAGSSWRWIAYGFASYFWRGVVGITEAEPHIWHTGPGFDDADVSMIPPKIP